MFESGNDQNGTQSNEQSSSPSPDGFRFKPSALDDTSMSDQISSGKMFAPPQPGGTGDGDFVNQNLLRIDPQTGIAYRPRAVPGDAVSLSPSARQLGELAGDAGKSVRDPITVLQEQQAEYGKPIPIRDSQGKLNPKYRMGIGHRILATVANFANGFARNGVSPIYVGPGALNNRYYEDEAMRQQNLDNINRQLLTQTREMSRENQPQKNDHYSGQLTGATQPPAKGENQEKTVDLSNRQPMAPTSQPPARQDGVKVRGNQVARGNSPKHKAFNPKTGEYIGSDDGKTWYPIPNPNSKRR